MLPEATTTIFRRLNATSRIDFGMEEIGGVSARSELAALEAAGIVTRSGTLERVRCTLCDEGHFSEVEYLASPLDPKHSAYYDCPHGSRAWLTGDQLQRWTATVPALCAALAGALGAIGAVREYSVELYELGRVRMSGIDRDFYLAVNITTRHARRRSAGATIAELPLGSVIVVLTSSIPSIRYSAFALVSLQDVLAIEDNGLLIDLGRVESTLAIANTRRLPPDGDLSPFRHSADYRTVKLNGLEFILTAQQAAVVRALHEAYENDTPELGQDYLLVDVVSTNMSRLRDVFKGLKNWTALIAKGSKKDTFRLNI